MGQMEKPTRTRIYQNHHLDSTRWDTFEPRADDIVIATPAKAGTTWTQTIVFTAPLKTASTQLQTCQRGGLEPVRDSVRTHRDQ
jgi:hypothetical protein